ncbi:hypothetical protein D3C72_151840 [compost metagenome]
MWLNIRDQFSPCILHLGTTCRVSLLINSLIALCDQLALLPAFSKLVTDTDIEQGIVLSFCCCLIASLGIIVQT